MTGLSWRSICKAAAVGLTMICVVAGKAEAAKEKHREKALAALEQASVALAEGDGRKALKFLDRAVGRTDVVPEITEELWQMLSTVRAELAQDSEADAARLVVCRLRGILGPKARASGAARIVDSPPQGSFSPPQRLYSPQPQYTSYTRKLRLQGVVISEVLIDTEGCVVWYNRLQGLHPQLDATAEKALSTWVFRPANLDGELVAVLWQLTTTFSLQ